MQVVLLELNEINFDFVEAYSRSGELPNFAHVIAEHGVQRTTSEQRYEELEPWIQWVTAHTGLSLAEHKIFRLGDAVRAAVPQMFEALEARGLKVGAVSPMNAVNRLRAPAFFVPDPWTRTPSSGGVMLRTLSSAVSAAVNDNAEGRIGPREFAALTAGALRYARPRNWPLYAKLALGSRGRPWRKAAVLDLLLADLFVRLTRARRPDFASLFLNAGAHVQHHYMFNARVYDGPLRNPDWYVRAQDDPVGEILRLYDRILGDVRSALPGARLLIATGLHQDPHPDVTYYYRLKSPADFLRRIGAPFVRVEPRMSRDFYVACSDALQARTAADALAQVRAPDGAPMFGVDCRGDDLFVELTYPREIAPGFAVRAGGVEVSDFADLVAFVAIKNGRHNGVGYFVDCGAPRAAEAAVFPLKELRGRIEAMFDGAAGAGERPRKAA